MRVTLVFVPPGGGEADHQMPFELPSIPQVGDYIAIMLEGKPEEAELGYETFIVRRTIWELKYPKTGSSIVQAGEHGVPGTIWVECEFARSGMMSESHKKNCDMYAGRGLTVPEQDATAY